MDFSLEVRPRKRTRISRPRIWRQSWRTPKKRDQQNRCTVYQLTTGCFGSSVVPILNVWKRRYKWSVSETSELTTDSLHISHVGPNPTWSKTKYILVSSTSNNIVNYERENHFESHASTEKPCFSIRRWSGQQYTAYSHPVAHKPSTTVVQHHAPSWGYQCHQQQQQQHKTSRVANQVHLLLPRVSSI